MKLTDLKATMDEQFRQVNQRFQQVDGRFQQVDERFQQVIEQLELKIISEGERTRRHFDVVAERMIAERNLVLDHSLATAERLTTLEASNAADHGRFERRLDNHDGRLTALEPTDPRTNP